MFRKKEKRFIVKESHTLSAWAGTSYIVVDTLTGVNYLSVGSLGTFGITPLLDAEGKVIVDK